MKTFLIAAAALVVGVALGFALNWKTIRYLRRKEREQQSAGQKEQRRQVKTSNLVLALLGLFLLAFIVAMIVTYWVTGGVPDTLIQYTLGAGGVEALLLAGIKISKVVSGKSEKGENNED